MRRFILLSIMLFSVSLSSFAQKDINDWKNEKSLEQQYIVFKKNLNYWNKSYFMSGQQLDGFYAALADSVADLEKKLADNANKIKDFQRELNSVSQQLKNTQAELDTSIKNQRAISVLGLNFDKNVYTLFGSLVIFALLVFLGIVFLLYKRSKKVTVRTTKDFNELKEEFEVHKKNALERYTKMNMELQHTRLELNRK